MRPAAYVVIASGVEIIHADTLVELITLAMARVSWTRKKGQVLVKLPGPAILGYHATRFIGETLGAFLRAAAEQEIARRKAAWNLAVSLDQTDRE